MLRQNGDNSVSVAEFRACYGRFQLLYRTSQAGSASGSNNDDDGCDDDGPNSGRVMVSFADPVPGWLSEEANAAKATVFKAFQLRA